jgi:hypothetical protein
MFVNVVAHHDIYGAIPEGKNHGIADDKSSESRRAMFLGIANRVLIDIDPDGRPEVVPEQRRHHPA